MFATVDSVVEASFSFEPLHVDSTRTMADVHNPWLAGGLAFAGGFLAHYLLQRYEHDISGHLPHLHHSSSSSSSNSSSADKEVVLPLPLRDTKNNPRLETDTLNRKQNLEHVKFAGKRVLMRVDYNVKIVSQKTLRGGESKSSQSFPH